MKTYGVGVYGIDSAYKSHELCLAIDRSIETGEKISIPLTE